MARQPLFLIICAAVLFVAALLYAVLPRFLPGYEMPPSQTAPADPVQTGATAPAGEPALSSTSLQPADGSVARPTAEFPAFAARDGGLYSTGGDSTP